ncbi:MAG: hypothetical protein AVDCRST_MAG11-2066 [uncultured Gemmatimonadaceae bacterium]|uniref:histidine kinase n=1 Tax=uncultured Gemmatimonadaceae bacterium TaxID=246130 RepID=A0A6J4L4D6_9BACT|nr:MAG: hypothetical protein AVDCRST_MAG11-2066 [uncultured Gemmatimonadaceae bacterium]
MVLVVDDTEANRYVVARWLERAGFRVVEAAGGAEALALAPEAADLVILDIHLPDVDGFEVARRLKADARTAHLPVLHLSAERVAPVDRAAGLEVGADGYLTHPVEPAELIASVRALLRLSQSERALREQNAVLAAAVREAERARVRVDRLQGLTAALAAAATQDEVCAAILREGGTALGTAATAVALPVPAAGPADRTLTLELVAASGWPEAATTAWGRFPASAPDGGALPPEVNSPIADAVRRGEPVWLEGGEAAAARYPVLRPLVELMDARAWLAVPFTLGEGGERRVLGGLTVVLREESHVSAEDRELLLAMGRQCAQALERARLADAERAARAEAERAAQLTSTVATHVAEGICLMDAAGRLTYMNPAAERLLGWTEAELLGEVLHDRVHYRRPDGRPFPMAECPLGRALAAAEPVLGLADQWIRKGGAFVHVVATCAPIVREGRVVGAVLSLHDDTARRTAEAERERLLELERGARAAAEAAYREAASANRAKGDFLAVMSHELRTPLNAIGGYAELIELGIRGPVTDEQRADLARIQAAQRHLIGLVTDVLNFVRVESGHVRYTLTEVPAHEAFGALEALVGPQFQAKGVAYAAAPCAPALWVRADRDRLQQVLLNLVTNALKFTGPGGRVEVACEARPRPGSGAVAFRVRDTGIGIPPEKLGAIFEPFVQVNQRLTRPQDGVGLGLAISRDLARGMGGSLTAESTPGLGSTFTLTLPGGSTPGA